MLKRCGIMSQHFYLHTRSVLFFCFCSFFITLNCQNVIGVCSPPFTSIVSPKYKVHMTSFRLKFCFGAFFWRFCVIFKLSSEFVVFFPSYCSKVQMLISLFILRGLNFYLFGVLNTQSLNDYCGWFIFWSLIEPYRKNN